MVEWGAGGGAIVRERSARERYQREVEVFEYFSGNMPGAREQKDRFVGLWELPRFHAWVEKVFEFDRHAPLGEYEKMDDEELDTVSHRLPAYLGLRHGEGLVETFIRLLPGNSVTLKNYLSLWGGLMALVALEHRGDFGKEEIWKLYGLLDRVLFGGKEFARVEQVPRVTAEYYRGLRTTRGINGLHVGSYSSNILRMLEIHGKERYGEEFEKPSMVLFGCMDLLTVASAYRNGRKKCAYEDAYDANETVIRLFHYPGRFLDLPLPKREGEPYRGCAEIVKLADAAG